MYSTHDRYHIVRKVVKFLSEKSSAHNRERLKGMRHSHCTLITQCLTCSIKEHMKCILHQQQKQNTTGNGNQNTVDGKVIRE
jgi:hypothetical protein